jgi:Nucleotidyl transferase AbiEii toxin, Type IV TA system
MTAAEAYELITHGGASDFCRVVAACNSFGPYCLIGDLAVNCYVDPVYTLHAEFVVSLSNLALRSSQLPETRSELRVEFTTDERYQPFPARSVEADVLGTRVRVACLEDVTQAKLWAWSGPRRRFSKRKKDELDLIRLAEVYPELRASYPPEMVTRLISSS